LVDTQRGITAIDISDPQQPRIAGNWVPQAGYPIQFSDIDADGQFVYGVTGIPFPEIFVVELKEGAQLVRVGSTALPATGQRVIVREKIAYVAAGPAGVAIIDATNPAAPLLTGRIAIPGFAKEVIFAGERLLVAASDGGLVVLEQTSASDSGSSQRTPHPPSGHLLPNTRHAEFDQPSPLRGGEKVPKADEGSRTSHAIIIVTSTADAGAGTLRDALTNVPAGDTITFDAAVFPSNAPATIRLDTVLPRITRDNITIDASNAGVILDGAALSDPFEAGIQINSRGNAVKGLQIMNFPNAGILITGNGGNVIGGDRSRGTGPSGEGNVISANRSAGITVLNPNGNRIVGNLIGTDVTGRQALGGQNIGVEIFYQPGNGDVTGPDLIGGTEPWEANVIAGNVGAEIYLHNGRGHSVIGNFLGTDPTGSMRVGSCSNGIATSVAAGNVIAGNIIAGEQFALSIIDTGSHSNLIANNWIGVTKSGVALTTNPFNGGVSIFESFNALVGNTIRNAVTMSNNRGNVAETVVIGNILGRGTLPQPPATQPGVRLDMAWRTFVGGPTPAERNSISGTTTGIWIQAPGIDRTFILGNDIRSSAIGIDVGPAASSVVQGNVITQNVRGVTVSAPTNLLRRNSIYANTVRGIEASASGIPLPPTLTEVMLEKVRGTTCARCTVDIYSDSGSQGQWYEGTTTADANGSFLFTPATVLRGSNVTATATDGASSTSAFSAPLPRPPYGPRRRAVSH
jgi:hypothetical protein